MFISIKYISNKSCQCRNTEQMLYKRDNSCLIGILSSTKIHILSTPHTYRRIQLGFNVIKDIICVKLADLDVLMEYLDRSDHLLHNSKQCPLSTMTKPQIAKYSSMHIILHAYCVTKRQRGYSGRMIVGFKTTYAISAYHH